MLVYPLSHGFNIWKKYDIKRFRVWSVYAVGLVIIVLMVWDLMFSDHGYFVLKQEYQQQQDLEYEIQVLRSEEEKIKAEIIRLRESPKFLEEVIHRELGYVYPDEFMLIMPSDENESYDSLKLEKKRNNDE